MYTFLSLLLVASVVGSPIKLTKPKLCVNCKYFIKPIPYAYFSESDMEYGVCSLFPKSSDNRFKSLVTGISKNKITEYTYCSTARKFNDMCGEEGKKYKKGVTKVEDLE